MDWMAGRSYYIGYSLIDRFDSIIFFHNYLYTWSIGIICSLILPTLFLFAPSSFHIKRTSHLFSICCVCLSNMVGLYIQPFMLSGLGEPNLPFHTCRLVVYLSTFAKPIGLYLKLLFSIERIFTKILRLNNYRIVFKKFYVLFIFLGISSILVIRLYEVLRLIPKNTSASDSNTVSRRNGMNDNNSTDRVLNFQYCYRSMNVETYAKILSFYIVQYWFEYVILAMIILVLLIMIIYQYCLPYFQRRSLSRLSVNTKFYFSLSSCIILFESILQFLHLTIDDVKNNNTDTQVKYLQIMLFVYNFRCIVLPLLICFTTCDPLKQWLYELLISRPYLDENTMIDQSEVFSSSVQTFATTNHNEHFDM